MIHINMIKVIRLAVMLVAVALMQMSQLPAEAASLCHPCDHKVVCQEGYCEEIVEPGSCMVYDTSSLDSIFLRVDGLYGRDQTFVDATVAESEGFNGAPGCSSVFRVEQDGDAYRAAATVDVSGKIEAQVFNLEGDAPIFVTIDER